MFGHQKVSARLMLRIKQLKSCKVKDLEKFLNHNKKELRVIPSDNTEVKLDKEIKLFKKIFRVILNKIDKDIDTVDLQKRFIYIINEIKKVRKEALIPKRDIRDKPMFKAANLNRGIYNELFNHNLSGQNNEEIKDKELKEKEHKEDSL